VAGDREAKSYVNKSVRSPSKNDRDSNICPRNSDFKVTDCLKKETIIKLAKKFHAFRKPIYSLQCSEKPITGL
jgi:hypothetical protein